MYTYIENYHNYKYSSWVKLYILQNKHIELYETLRGL